MRVLASLNKRRVFMTCGVLCIALLCGQVMQSLGSNPMERVDNTKAKPLPVDPASNALRPPPKMPGRVKAANVVSIKKVSKPDAACLPQLTLKRAPGAMIDLTFQGCKERSVVLTHGAVQVTAQTNSAGTLRQSVPALDQKSVVTVSFDGDAIQSTIEMPDANLFQHVAILWQGPQTLQMHAFEFGAKRNQFGHVWAGAPKSPQRATRGNGGFLTKLGDGSGASAEIYSFPAGQSQNRGVVRLVVEADVTPANCGQQINAVALQTGPLGGIDSTEVALKMPQCEDIGRLVRLQNLFQDMRLAMR
ncbi:MAG: hypothetical protein ABJF50_04440 [Paracoccaceae bacterium]